jgi:acyl-CoA thioesterase FadM
MNLYLRLLWTLFRAWRLPRIAVTDTIEVGFRVLPNDLDINLHMNNGRYLTIADLALIEFFVRTGFVKALMKKGWRPMLGGAIITYRKQLAPFARYTLRFRWITNDEFWAYMESTFVRADGSIAAKGIVKGGVVSNSGLVPMAQSVAALQELVGETPVIPAIPHYVQQWIDAEKSLWAA